MRFSKIGAGVAALLLVPALASCSSSSSSGSASAAASSPAAEGGNLTAPLPTGGAELADTTWALSGFASTTESVADAGITLEFTADQASGSAGINTYSAGYTSAADGTLTFTAIASTQMAGDEAMMALETEYLAALGSVTGYSVNGGLLDLFAGPDQILTFTEG